MTRKPTCVACKGAGGIDYTAGTGIVIESNEISADTSVLATKTELPDMDDYQPKLTAGSGIDITNDVISAEFPGFVRYADNDWAVFVSNGVVTEDLLLYMDFQITGLFYIPKGTPTSLHFNNVVGPTSKPTIDNNYMGYVTNAISQILNSSPTVGLNVAKLEVHTDSTAGTITINYTLNETYYHSKGSQLILYRRA